MTSKEVFCLCRQPWNDDDDMVCCDGCEDWFHPRCVGLKNIQEVAAIEYFCPACVKAQNMSFPSASSSGNSTMIHESMTTSSESSDTEMLDTPGISQSFASAPKVIVSECHESRSLSPSLVKPPKSGRSRASSLSLSKDRSGRPARRRRSTLSSSMIKKPTSQIEPRSVPSELLPKESSFRAISDSETPMNQRRRCRSANSTGSDSESKRLFHNERERMRRSTIRNLFEELRKNVPNVEGQDGTSDRQILVEAAKHISSLHAESKSLEEQLIQAEMDNVQLRLSAMGCSSVPTNLAQTALLLSGAASIAQKREEFAQQQFGSPRVTTGFIVDSPSSGLQSLVHVVEQELGQFS